MAPKKKYVLSTTIRWSSFEVTLLRYLGSLSERTMSEEVRTALRCHARQLPSFDAEEFRRFVKRDALNKLPAGPERERVRLESEAFLRQVATARPSTLDPLSGGEDADIVMRASAADFELDD